MVEFLPSSDRGQGVLLADSVGQLEELAIVVVNRIHLSLVLKILAAHIVEAEDIDEVVLQAIVHRV